METEFFTGTNFVHKLRVHRKSIWVVALTHTHTLVAICNSYDFQFFIITVILHACSLARTNECSAANCLFEFYDFFRFVFFYWKCIESICRGLADADRECSFKLLKHWIYRIADRVFRLPRRHTYINGRVFAIHRIATRTNSVRVAFEQRTVDAKWKFVRIASIYFQHPTRYPVCGDCTVHTIHVRVCRRFSIFFILFGDSVFRFVAIV